MSLHLRLPPLSAAQRDKLKVTMHWTGGNYNGKPDTHAYHFVVEPTRVLNGVPIERNIAPLKDGYARHTGRANSNNIGISIAAMFGSSEGSAANGEYGEYPILEEQADLLIEAVAQICKSYNIPVVPSRVLLHSEWTTVKGIVQNGKWDINYLPHLDMRDRLLPDGTRRVGNYLRAAIRDRMGDMPMPAPVDEQETEAAEREMFLHLAALFDLAKATGSSEQVLSHLNALRKLKPFKGQTR